MTRFLKLAAKVLLSPLACVGFAATAFMFAIVPETRFGEECLHAARWILSQYE